MVKTMRFEVKYSHSLRIRIGDWRVAAFMRPWFSVDFAKIGEMFPRGKAIISYLWTRIKAVQRRPV